MARNEDGSQTTIRWANKLKLEISNKYAPITKKRYSTALTPAVQLFNYARLVSSELPSKAKEL